MRSCLFSRFIFVGPLSLIALLGPLSSLASSGSTTTMTLFKKAHKESCKSLLEKPDPKTFSAVFQKLIQKAQENSNRYVQGLIQNRNLEEVPLKMQIQYLDLIIQAGAQNIQKVLEKIGRNYVHVAN
ncbi:MAG: hypothetical protein D6797_05665, partial [Bdellovibrio sp.]